MISQLVLCRGSIELPRMEETELGTIVIVRLSWACESIDECTSASSQV